MLDVHPEETGDDSADCQQDRHDRRNRQFIVAIVVQDGRAVSKIDDDAVTHQWTPEGSHLLRLTHRIS